MATEGRGVRSIDYWIWTSFSVDDQGPIRMAEDDQYEQIFANAKAFLALDDEFIPRPTDPVSKFRQLLAIDKEWRDCELPWHPSWPNRPPG